MHIQKGAPSPTDITVTGIGLLPAGVTAPLAGMFSIWSSEGAQVFPETYFDANALVVNAGVGLRAFHNGAGGISAIQLQILDEAALEPDAGYLLLLSSGVSFEPCHAVRFDLD